MTPYRVEYHAKAAAEVVGLPDAAFEYLVSKLVAVRRDPWEETEPDDPKSPQFRLGRFGEYGLVQVHVDDDRHLVCVYSVTWAG